MHSSGIWISSWVALVFEPLDIPETEVLAAVSTGHLPDPDTVARLVRLR